MASAACQPLVLFVDNIDNMMPNYRDTITGEKIVFSYEPRLTNL